MNSSGPTAKITVATHAEGVDMLMEGAKSANGTAYAPLVSALKSQGVTFEICEITLKNRGLMKDQFIQKADFTPSGVVRIAKLQGQGFAYMLRTFQRSWCQRSRADARPARV